jgi:prepilin-type N-terminal cleavage/methylation domain-containing protein
MPTSGPGRSDAAGFTLVELLVVIVILAVATAVALTTLNSRRDRLGDAASALAGALQALALESRLAGLPVAWRCGEADIELLRWQPQVVGELQPRGEWLATGRAGALADGEVRVERVELDGQAIDCRERPIVLVPHAALPETSVVLAARSAGDAAAETRVLRGDSAGRYAIQAAAP